MNHHTEIFLRDLWHQNVHEFINGGCLSTEAYGKASLINQKIVDELFPEEERKEVKEIEGMVLVTSDS